MKMQVLKLQEAGFSSAMYGLSLNKNQKPEDMIEVAKKLAPLGLGHNKFLEHIVVWVAVTAPRYWWQDADTYRLTSKQSQSTNHTILRRELEYSDFEDDDIDIETLCMLNRLIRQNDFLKLKKKLPEGFLQTREWMLNYQNIRNIILQRPHHKLPHWREFCKQLLVCVEHSELLPSLDEPTRSKVRLVRKDDGIWLMIDTPSGKSTMINLCGLHEYIGGVDGIARQAIEEAASE